MSSQLHPSYRRRSRSASSPFIQYPSDDPNRKGSIKRSRPSYRNTPSYKDIITSQPTEKWDVDQWRRGKRARRDSRVSSARLSPPYVLLMHRLTVSGLLIGILFCCIRPPLYPERELERVHSPFDHSSIFVSGIQLLSARQPKLPSQVFQIFHIPPSIEKGRSSLVLDQYGTTPLECLLGTPSYRRRGWRKSRSEHAGLGAFALQISCSSRPPFET